MGSIDKIEDTLNALSYIDSYVIYDLSKNGKTHINIDIYIEGILLKYTIAPLISGGISIHEHRNIYGSIEMLVIENKGLFKELKSVLKQITDDWDYVSHKKQYGNPKGLYLLELSLIDDISGYVGSLTIEIKPYGHGEDIYTNHNNIRYFKLNKEQLNYDLDKQNKLRKKEITGKVYIDEDDTIYVDDMELKMLLKGAKKVEIKIIE